jgi:outer membrane protein TolC
MDHGHRDTVGPEVRKLVKPLFGLALAGLLSACTVTPQPFGDEELTDAAATYRKAVTADQEPVDGPIDLYEAMARALKYNLDKRVEMMEEAVRSKELDLAHYDMLPQVVANANYNGRNNYSGASSFSLLSGQPSLEPSTSSDKDTWTYHMGLTWDVLDFGISYARAKQSADRVLISEENKRKVVNRIIEDVRTAYWRAVSSQRLLDKLIELEGSVENALSDSQKLFERRVSAPLTALTYQRELVTIKRETQRMHRELRLAKLQLAALMNLGPAEDYALVIPDRTVSSTLFQMDPEEMVQNALWNRPELREVSYLRRINQEETQIEMLKVFPNLRLFFGGNYDSNTFLFNNDWTAWGAHASWNLINVFNYNDRMDAVEAQDRLLEKRALALSMAIMTQVYVSRARYDNFQRELDTAAQYHGIQSRILEQIRAGARAGRISKQTLIREEMNTLVAQAQYDIAYADLQNAFANIYASMGLDPFAADLRGDESVEELATSLKALWQSRGDKVAAASM